MECLTRADGPRGLSAPTPLHGAHDGSGIGRRLARGVQGRRARPLRPALRLLRDGGNLWPRGRASSDVGAHLRFELGAPRGRSRAGLAGCTAGQSGLLRPRSAPSSNRRDAPTSLDARPRGHRFPPSRSSRRAGRKGRARRPRTPRARRRRFRCVVRSGSGVGAGSPRRPSPAWALDFAREPFLNEVDTWKVTPGQRLRVFRAVGHCHRGDDPDEINPARRKA